MSVGLSVVGLCEKVTFRVSDGNLILPKTFLPTYLCDSSDSCDSCDSSDSSERSDSSDSSDSCDQNKNFTNNFFHQKTFFPKK